MYTNTGLEYPKIVCTYRQRYDRMAEPSHIIDFKAYTRSILGDPIDGLNWELLLAWEHRHFAYTKGDLPKPRAEMPVDIIKQAMGRCGEFALLYIGLLIANNYDCRLILDCSKLKDESKTSAGDHVWNEVGLNNQWVHVDPTERRINQPLMYVNDWNKDVNLVYAIARKEILDVTDTYRKRARNIV